MSTFDERRDFLRMHANCSLRYRPIGSTQFAEGHCLNISGSGILFQAEEAVEVGKGIQLQVIPKNRITPPFTAFIEVNRCVATASGRYQIAGAIAGIKSE